MAILAFAGTALALALLILIVTEMNRTRKLARAALEATGDGGGALERQRDNADAVALARDLFSGFEADKLKRFAKGVVTDDQLPTEIAADHGSLVTAPVLGIGFGALVGWGMLDHSPGDILGTAYFIPIPAGFVQLFAALMVGFGLYAIVEIPRHWNARLLFTQEGMRYRNGSRDIRIAWDSFKVLMTPVNKDISLEFFPLASSPEFKDFKRGLRAFKSRRYSPIIVTKALEYGALQVASGYSM